MPHATATLNGKVIAEADKWETVEGNIYFPPSSVEESTLSKAKRTAVCGWKGTASYYNITVDGKETTDAAWYYPDPKEKALNIKDHLAFDKSKVQVKSE